MAKDLMRALRLCCQGGLLLLGILPAFALAQTLADPMRPPDELSARPRGPAPNILRSIIISPTRRAAIINGQTVELGEKVGGVR